MNGMKIKKKGCWIIIMMIKIKDRKHMLGGGGSGHIIGCSNKNFRMWMNKNKEDKKEIKIIHASTFIHSFNQLNKRRGKKISAKMHYMPKLKNFAF